MKNIYAIATGMAHAQKAGENTRSMLLTRALAEMSRFAVQLGANPLTFLGLAGVGDCGVDWRFAPYATKRTPCHEAG